MSRGRLPVLLALSLLGSAFSVPTEWRVRRGYGNNELDSKLSGGYKDLVAASTENRKIRQEDEPKDNAISEKDAATETEPSKVNLGQSAEDSKPSYPPPSIDNDDDDSDEDEDFNVTQPSGGGGSSIFSLLKLANALFPGSSSSNIRIRNVIRKLLIRYQNVLTINRRPEHTELMRRIDTSANEIDDSYIADLKPPPFQKQEIEESRSDENDTESISDSDTDEDDDDNNDKSEETIEDQDNAAEESVENSNKDNEKESKSKQESSNGDNDDDDDYSEEPEGDGQGGGILGLLAGLSGGEDGQSDLGSLLAAVSGIVVNLSGDGVDVNALIASAIGLFVGLLSEGEENPGAVIASYLLTSLDTLTGGGAQNNGAFFGTFLSKLIKGTSAAPENSSEEEGNGMPMADSGGFLISFIMGLLGDMSKGSSGGSSHR